MAQLVLPSQLRGRPPAPGSRRGLVRLKPVADDVARFTAICTEPALGDATVLCESPSKRTHASYTTRTLAEVSYEQCVRDSSVHTAELRDDGSLIRARYLPRPASAPAIMAPAPAPSTASSARSMSTGAKVAIGAGVVGALYLLTRRRR